jgi:tripartite-type tricarboxylate transporter receptor subunit TctC
MGCSIRRRLVRCSLVRCLAFVAAAVIGLAAFGPARSAAAEVWPSRPVRIIIPLGAGGGGDVFTRLMAEQLQKRLGQPFVVENRPGGGLNIGTRACAEADPDGYTICVLSSEGVIYNQFAFKSLPFDPEKDFEPVANLFINSNALVTTGSLNVKTIPQLVAYAKSHPGKLSYGTFTYVLVHFMEQLNKKNGIDIVRVPFRSGNEVMNAVVSGSSQVAFLGLSNMLGQIKSGQITGLALNSGKRSPLFPDIPTLQEATGEDYPPSWFGLFVPAKTPQPIIDKLHDEVAAIIGAPDFVQKHFIERAIEPAIGPREEFVKFIADGRKVAARIAKESTLPLR